MYVSATELFGRQRATSQPGAPRVSGTVVALGAVSLLTDISSEAVAAVLPLYLTVAVGLSPLAYGLVDGLYQGVSAAVRVPAGWLADRTDRPKWVALVGYGLSALSRLALLPATGFAAITAVVTADRLGKGLRTAPRDSLITGASDPAALGRSFGVHRAMDTTGAMIGPLIAFAILAAVPLGYDLVFVVSFAFALLGVTVLALMVPDLRLRRSTPTASAPAAPRARSTVRPRLRELREPRFVRLCAVFGVLGLLSVSDGFLYLSLQGRDGFAATWFPLLFVGTSVAYLALAVPFGRLADRVGRVRVLVLGHVALLAAYLCVGGPVSGLGSTVAALLLLGTFYAATDGVLAAVAGQIVPARLRATGIATAQTVVVLARLASSLLFGLLWTLTSSSTALLFFTAALAVAIPVAALVLRDADARNRTSTWV